MRMPPYKCNSGRTCVQISSRLESVGATRGLHSTAPAAVNRHSMYLSRVLCLLLPGVAYAFSGGWTPLGYSKLHHGRAGSSFAPDAAESISPCRPAPTKLRAQPNEYEVFFNKASKLGGAAISGLTPEERADRALEGEKIEDEIIEIATVLREKADAMVAKTGSINFEIIQPMIDEISELKNKYKQVVGAAEADDGNRPAEVDGNRPAAEADDGEEEANHP